MAETSLEFEIVVVGAGPAGLAAACAAAECGRRVAVVDDTPWVGGQIWRGPSATSRSPQAREWIDRLARCGAKVLGNSSVIAVPTPGRLLAECPDGPREIRFAKLIVATGARELFLPFPGWTLPGVAGPGGLQAMVKHGWPIKDQRVVVAGSGPLLLAVAKGLRPYGARIVSVAEQAPWRQVARFACGLWRHPSKLWQGLRLLQPAVYSCGTWPVRAEGADRVEQVVLTDGRSTWTRQCDALACAFGLVPNVELPLALGCRLREGFVQVDELQTTSVGGIYCAGEPTGIGGADCALVEGLVAGYAAAEKPEQAQGWFEQRSDWHRFRGALATGFALRPELSSLATDETIVCRCEDVPLGALRRYNQWREAKLQTRCGMGACQGRVCGAATRLILGWGMESVRTPLFPARVDTLAKSSQS